MILRCTTKLLALLDTRPRDLPAQPGADDDWYADVLWIERRKCLLLCHAGTLLSVFAADVRKADFTPIGPFVVARISEVLADEELPPTAFGSLERDAVRLAKTFSRQVLGCMRADALTIEYAIAREGGLARCDLQVLNRELRRTLHIPKGREPVFPLDEARRRATYIGHGCARPYLESDSPGGFQTRMT